MDSNNMFTTEVIYIRHAESVENIKLQWICDIIQKLLSLQIPTWNEIIQCFSQLLQFDFDPQLTVHGQRQLLDLKLILNNEKFDFNEYQHIIYSPLQRTKETCFTIIPIEKQQICYSLDIIKEISPVSYLFDSYNMKRRDEFEQWIYQLKTNKIIIFGHCQYFCNLFQTKVLIRNCDVWKSTITFTNVNKDSNNQEIIKGIWNKPNLLYRTELANKHPIQKLISFIWKQSNIDNDGDNENDIASTMTTTREMKKSKMKMERVKQSVASVQDTVEDDLDDHIEQPICRICQLKQSEASDLKMIQPCLCSGSVSHVHIKCLNIWRQTSSNAYYTCSICKYNYQLHRTWYAELCVNDIFILFITIIMILIICYLTGYILLYLIKKINPSIQPVEYICNSLNLDIHIFNRHCTRRLMLFDTIKTIYYRNQDHIYLLIQTYYNLFRYTPILKHTIICQPFIYDLFSIFLIGCLTIGSIVFLMYLVHLIYDQFRFIAHANGIFGNHNLFIAGNSMLVIIWFLSLSSIARNRLFLVVGIMIAIRELYCKLIILARKFSSYIGDMILEPTRL